MAQQSICTKNKTAEDLALKDLNRKNKNTTCLSVQQSSGKACRQVET